MALWPEGEVALPVGLHADASSIDSRICRTSLSASGFQRQRLQFLSRCAECAELIDRGARRRERERVEWLCQKLVEICFGADSGGDVRVEFWSGCDLQEIRDVFEEGGLNVAA